MNDMEEKDIMAAVRDRHSVRSYTDKRIPDEIRAELQKTIDRCNTEGGLHIQMRNDAPGVFDGLMARSFSGVSDYIALIGKKTDDLEEKAGYYGADVMLRAQQLGLNTCWVVLTYSKRKVDCEIADDEKMVGILSLGYGKDQGVAHKSKAADELGKCEGEWPEWFRNGIEAAMLAPTAMNKQKFRFELQADGRVKAVDLGGSYSAMGLGIAKRFFEIGAGKESFQWA